MSDSKYGCWGLATCGVTKRAHQMSQSDQMSPKTENIAEKQGRRVGRRRFSEEHLRSLSCQSREETVRHVLYMVWWTMVHLVSRCVRSNPKSTTVGVVPRMSNAEKRQSPIVNRRKGQFACRHDPGARVRHS